jgi:AhpD family alkylhydroperoxidase
MKTVLPGFAAAFLLALVPVDEVRSEEVRSDDPPAFMKETLPEGAVGPAWEQFQAVMNDGELDPKTKELIALAVSAQVPCDYCIHYHTRAAEAHGASDEQIKEALAAAALVRHWSTTLNGSEYDMNKWRQEVDAMFTSD